MVTWEVQRDGSHWAMPPGSLEQPGVNSIEVDSRLIDHLIVD
jgi:hypothetical protein